MAGLQTSKQYVIFLVLDLFRGTKRLLMLVNSCGAFVCRWIIMNCFISNLYRAGKGRIVLVAMVLTSLASLSANSLPETTGWPRIH